MNLTEKLYSIGFDYLDVNPLTGNALYEDKEGNQIEIISDFTDEEGK